MIEVWAPRAAQVEIVVGDERRELTRDDEGIWRAPDPPVGADYLVSVDGGPPRPDPRARCQPGGVHGPSRVIATDFPWTDHDFVASPLALIYELHVGTFTPGGTFESAIERLDDLVALGVSHVELMPVAEFPGTRGWGYDGVGFFAAHHAYGGLAGLQRLVDAAHARGLAVILDVVYNHFGPDGNYLAGVAPVTTSRHHTPWGEAIDYTQPPMRRFVVDNALFWLRDAHLDGLRLDATDTIVDDSPHHILRELSDDVRGLGRPALLIAEHDRDDPRIWRPGGWGLDAFWYDEYHHAIHAALTGERGGYYARYGNLASIAETLHGSPDDAPGDRAIGFVQNHDQIGNRALGERLGHIVSPGRLRLAAALLFASPFVPMIFQGEEWNASTPFQYFTDHESPELARAVREGRRAEHAAFMRDASAIPDPQDRATFERSRLDWSERERTPHREVLDWYRALIALRRDEPALRDGRRDRTTITVDEHARTIVVGRGPIVVAGNLGDRPARLPLPAGPPRLAHPSPPHDSVIAPDAVAVYSAG